MNEAGTTLRVINKIIDHVGMDGGVGLFGGYFLGAVPFGLLLCFLAGYGDIRKIGSGNIGATNVLRTGNKPLALLTLLLDSGKGAVAVLIGWMISPGVAFGAALGAVLGHNFPVWLKFKGGKGVATTLGVIIALNWITGLLACLIWLLTAVVSRYSSLSALIALAFAPVFSHHFGDPKQIYLIGLLAAIVWIRHRENIQRLLNGTEPKIVGKK